MQSLYLAWRYISFHRVQSLLLVLALALIVAVPLVLNSVLSATESQLTARADATPMLIGSRGSSLDLTMSSLYFTDDQPGRITLASSERVWDSGFAAAIPLYNRFRAQQAPVIGTTLDYFDFRNLTLAKGRSLAVLGETVLGARFAERAGLGPGDTVITSPDNLFDLAGSYPLRLQVVGVLNANGSADDTAVFVDLKTAWVIEGIGHGHEDIEPPADSQSANQVANAAITQYREITDENLDSFHFHGAADSYPLTAVIADPYDERSATLLRGRYLDSEDPEQLILPQTVISSLLNQLFAIKAIFDGILWVVATATLLTLSLTVYLSWQLRRGERYTLYKLGSHRLTVVRLLLTEALLLIALSLVLAAALHFLISPLAADLATNWLVSNN